MLCQYFWKRYRQIDLSRLSRGTVAKVAIIKTYSAAIAFFSFLLYFSFAGVIFELIGRKKPVQPFFTQPAANFVRFPLNKSAGMTESRYVYVYTVLMLSCLITEQ